MDKEKLKDGLIDVLTVLQRHSQPLCFDVDRKSRIRFVYWADDPVGNIGVSFADPVSAMSMSKRLDSAGEIDIVTDGFRDSD